MDIIKLTKPNGEEVKIFKDNNKIIIRFFNDDDSLEDAIESIDGGYGLN